jgi:putative SOS response-associated peptidase YedK
MCGRYTMFTTAEALEKRFHAVLPLEAAGVTYNAAPSQAQLAILNDNPQTIVRAAWGFVPAWADGKPEVKPLINARAETVATEVPEHLPLILVSPFAQSGFHPRV